jgi:hypothetical protein
MSTSTIRFRFRRFSGRSGSTLLELLVSAALLASLLVIINQSFIALRRQSRLVDRRFVAQQVLENVLEEFCQRPWETLSTESVQQIRLPDFADGKLPHCDIYGEVVDETDPVLVKRVVLRLGWSDYPGQPPQSIALTAWAFPLEGYEQ